jgi:lincosamide nucleotidyltransferase A/C/D/E
MTENDVINLLKKAKQINVTIWISGGWGISALVGKQIRPHNDIDIFVQKTDADKFVQLLVSDGYRETKMEYTTDNHTVWQDSDNRIIDLHLYELVEDGNLRFDDYLVPIDLFDGKGTIGGMEVQCLTAEAQLLYHEGYEHTEKDKLDVLLLCETFGFEIPEQYK